jgi:hypothetical protein
MSTKKSSKALRSNNLLKIHWSVYVSAILCFGGAYIMYQQYVDKKTVLKNGYDTEAIVIEKTRGCRDKKGYNWFKVQIVKTNEKPTLETTMVICENTFIGDTLLVRYLEKYHNCYLAKNEDLYSKIDYYSVFFAFLVGVYCLGYGYYCAIKKK